MLRTIVIVLIIALVASILGDCWKEEEVRNHE